MPRVCVMPLMPMSFVSRGITLGECHNMGPCSHAVSKKGHLSAAVRHPTGQLSTGRRFTFMISPLKSKPSFLKVRYISSVSEPGLFFAHLCCGKAHRLARFLFAEPRFARFRTSK